MHRCLIGRNQRPEHLAKVYALGMFDGVHIGHMALIQTAVRIAGEHETPCGVYTFDVHPAQVVCADRTHYALMSLDDRLDLIESAGVDVAIVHAFDTELASMPPEAFVSRVLHDTLGAQCVVVGFDYPLGTAAQALPWRCNRLRGNWAYACRRCLRSRSMARRCRALACGPLWPAGMWNALLCSWAGGIASGEPWRGVEELATGWEYQLRM